MKKKLFTVILASTLLLSACSSGQKTETTSSIEETTTTTTEATTTTTEATTTTQSPIANAKPEDYADIHYSLGKDDYEVDYEDETVDPFASDFEFVDAELIKDDQNNMIIYPNYQAGKNMVVKFKSDKQFKFGAISQRESSKQYDTDYYLLIKDYEKANIVKIASATKGYTSTISKFLKYNNGVYTLTIPSKYAKTDSQFFIQLYTKGKSYKDGDYLLGDSMTFFIRCEKEPLPAKPTFTIEQHAGVSNEVEATDLTFVNAKIEVENDEHTFYPGVPTYTAGQDMVITFKCDKELTLSVLMKVNENGNVDIKDPNFVTCASGTYTVTIPARYAQSKDLFSFCFESADGKELYFYFICI